MAQEKECQVVFMGTPDFAVHILDALIRHPHCKVVGVYTRQDKPAHRGMKLSLSPVKIYALEHNLRIFQPANFKTSEAVAELQALRPDFLVVAAYGLILPASVLQIPKLEALNVHASMLPRYRGAAPIQRAIMENWQDTAVTGVSIMRIVPKLDAGPVYAATQILIADHNAGTMHDLLAETGGALLVSVMEQILDGSALCVEQKEAEASYAPKINKEERVVVWQRPVRAVHAHIRSLYPKPGAYGTFLFEGWSEPLTLHLTPGLLGQNCVGTQVGTLRLIDNGLEVACTDCWYRLTSVKPRGHSTMPVVDFIHGYLKAQACGICGQAI